MVKKVLAQLIPLAFGSIVFSVLLHYFNVSYIVGGLFGVAVQFAGFYAFRSCLNAYVALQNKKLENERMKELSYQGLGVTCPCFKAVREFVPIKLNAPNYYKCSECKKVIGVYITPETALVTEPQESSLEAVNSILANGLIGLPKEQ